VNSVLEASERRQSAGAIGRVGSVAPACVALYLAVVAGLLIAILRGNHGMFTYTLDDPYIHLALAENLAHGHYGINPGEPSSPSSSIVWPFLLTPFAGRAWTMYMPLAWNMLFCGIAAWLIGRIVDGWGGAWREARPSWLLRFALAVALMLVANLAGLTFVGMEHGLQVLLAVACAAGLVEAFAGQPIPAWCVGAAALGPMVRYENFALVVAVGVALVGQSRMRAAVRLGCLSLVGPVLYSCFLLSQGLPALPTSVLVKGRAYSMAGGQAMSSIKSMYWGNVGTMREFAWWAQLAVAMLLVWMAARERQRVRRFVLGGAVLAAILQLAVGRFNWFHRYEVYATIFTALLASTALVETALVETAQVETARLRCGLLVIGLLALGSPYALALWETPAAAGNVYQQQYQMHRFVADFYRKPVAVNDLGWVSYRRPAGVYVLDLWGLASPEASRQEHKDAAWLDDITGRHGTGLAIIYPDWYEEGAPDQWDPLATMCLGGERVSVARPCVVFYRTEVGDEALLTQAIAAFARTLPAGVKMTLGQDASSEPQ
jgi:hypothetical protein